jgi:hypothetical protein
MGSPSDGVIRKVIASCPDHSLFVLGVSEKSFSNPVLGTPFAVPGPPSPLSARQRDIASMPPQKVS